MWETSMVAATVRAEARKVRVYFIVLKEWLVKELNF
jgi:hypothetical protein